MFSSRPLTPLQANGGKHLVCAPKVYVPSEQRLKEFAGEGVGKKIEAPAALLITSAPPISSGTRLFQQSNLKPNSQV
jgi:hypothetical protein